MLKSGIKQNTQKESQKPLHLSTLNSNGELPVEATLLEIDALTLVNETTPKGMNLLP